MDYKKGWEQMTMNFMKEREKEWVESKIKGQKLISNCDYITWLFSFEPTKLGFVDEICLYDDKVGNEDKDKVKLIPLFFEAIDNYARRNYISSSEYKIRLNNHGLIIGKAEGQGISFCCKEIPVDNPEAFIDFNDIMTNKTRRNTIGISQSLEAFKEIVEGLVEHGIPIEVLEETFAETIVEIKKEGPKTFTKNNSQQNPKF